jgi:nitrite reductase (NO-forming)
VLRPLGFVGQIGDPKVTRTQLIGFAGLFVAAIVAGIVLGIVFALPSFPDIEYTGGPPLGTVPPDGPPSMVIDVSLLEFEIRPAVVRVAAGTDVVFHVHNIGDNQHDFEINGEFGTPRLNPGDTAEVRAGPVEERLLAWCTVPGHRDLGMELEVVITG